MLNDPKIPNSRKKFLLTVIFCIVVFFCAASFTASNTVRSLLIQREGDTFAHDTGIITTRLKTSLEEYADVAYNGRSLVLSNKNLNQDDWKRFYNSQSVFARFEGLSSVSYVELVPHAKKAEFIAKMRAKTDFGADYSITPAGDREVYALASLVVSETQIPLTGLDVYGSPDRKAVYDASVNSSTPTMSEQFTLSSGFSGMFMTLPVTQNNAVKGFIVAALHSDDYLANALEPDQLGRVGVIISDATNASEPKQIYTTPSQSNKNDDLTRADTLLFGGRTWKIEYRASANYTQGILRQALPNVIMVVGFLVTFLIMLVVYIGLHIRFHVNVDSD